MATDSEVDIRDRLDELGARRAAHDASDKELVKEIKKALNDAEAAGVSISEIARRLNVHRTTIYRVYKPKGR